LRGLIRLFLLCLLAFIGLAIVAIRINPLKGIGSFLVKEDPLEVADLIVVMAGDLWCRAREAAELYREGYARNILLMREVKPKGLEALWHMGIVYPERYLINKQVMLKIGVPERAIIISSIEANNTYQEAHYIVDYMKRRHWHSAIIVTSKFHSRRACTTIEAVSGGQTKIICRPTRYDPDSPALWWTERRQARELFFEYQKLFLYSIYLLFQRINPF